MKNSNLYYSVGALLYCPANNHNIADAIITEKFGRHFSLALCLEDTIGDNFVEEAESILIHSIYSIYEKSKTCPFFLPKIFIRIRSAAQILDLVKRLGEAKEIIIGFILPKFSLENADNYIDTLQKINSSSKKHFYLMPILESPDILHLQNRYSILYRLKEKLGYIENHVLNIRVGGNDLCYNFGFRRNIDESIHHIGPISSLFSDIITVFGMDYVISGPVWEYYSGEGWEQGLKTELKEDRLCGFVGKTVIHPNQIELVNNAYQVSKKDLEDAKSILNWDQTSHSLVSGNSSGERMNEYKIHTNWARKIMLLSETFGVRSTCPIMDTDIDINTDTTAV